MKVRNVNRRAEEQVELQMTPMIDCVFLLLIFFLLTFKIVAPEGDFNIKMPAAAPSEGIPEPDQLPPIPVRLKAGSGGRLASIHFGTRPLGRNFEALRNSVRTMVGDDPGPGVLDTTEVELDCDYNLDYEWVIEAITAVSGYRDEDDHVHKLVEKIKFKAPQ
jgi:biopolymer transport protein ExbD